MESFKREIIKALEQLPDDTAAFYQYDKIGLLPKPIQMLLAYMQKVYAPQQLRAYMQAEETAYEFPFLINELTDAFAPLSEWLDDNRVIFAQGKLSDYTRELIDKRRKQIIEVENETLRIKHLSQELSEQAEQAKEKIKLLERHEHKNKYLLGEADNFKARKTELENIKRKVEAGGLEQLEQDTKALEREMLDLEIAWREKIQIKEDAQKRLDQRKQYIQDIISGTAFIGSANKLFDEIKNKCEKHNEAIVAEYGKSVEELEIRIDFNSRTSKGVLDTNMEDKLKKAEQLLKEVEQSIKAKVLSKKPK